MPNQPSESETSTEVIVATMPTSPASPRVRIGLFLAAAAAALLAMFAWMCFTTPASASPALSPPSDTSIAASGDLLPSAAITFTFDKVGPGSAYPGQAIGYYLDVKNTSGYTSSFVLTDTLPTSYVAWFDTKVGSGVNCAAPSGGKIYCTVSNMPSSSAVLRAVTITVLVNTSVTVGTYIINTAEASALGDPVAPKSDAVYTLVTSAATSTSTPTGTPAAPDAAECNNSFDYAYRISPGQTVPTLNFIAPPEGSCGSLPIQGADVDYFVVRGKTGDWYDALTSSLSAGIDTYMRVYDADRNLVAENDDSGSGTFASEVIWKARYDGDYYVQITNLDPNNPRSATYAFKVSALSNSPTATATRTPVPGPTTVPGLDACEPNWNFGHACTIAPGSSLVSMNFVSAAPGEPDNDFYQLWQKPGLYYSCSTENLAPGMDTNIILYDANQNGMMGNDDCTAGSFNSCVGWTSTYTGWVYFLIGSVVNPPPSTSTYDFKCNVIGPTATPTATPTLTPGLPPPVVWPTATQPPAPTPVTPPTAAPTPMPTATQSMAVFVLPTPTQVVSAQVVRVDVRVYYDANDSGAPDPGEGVLGMRAQLVDTAGNLLDYRLTGANGLVSLTAIAVGDVYLEVPYLGVRVVVAGPRSSVEVRIVPQALPGSIP